MSANMVDEPLSADLPRLDERGVDPRLLVVHRQQQHHHHHEMTMDSIQAHDPSRRRSDDRSSLDLAPLQASGVPAMSSPQPGLGATIFKPVRDLRKTAHNVVEKRYRVNLNGKIAALSHCLPQSRVRMASRPSADQPHPTKATTMTTTTTSKLGKAEVLTNAVEYIKQLEARLQRMTAENASLRMRITELKDTQDEDGMTATGVDGGEKTIITTTTVRRPSREQPCKPAAVSRPAFNTTTSLGKPQGMISVPEDMRRLRVDQPQLHYAHSLLIDHAAAAEHADDGSPGGRRPESTKENGFMHRLMVGSLAGIL